MMIKAQALADFVAEFKHKVALKPEMTISEGEALKEQNLDEDLVR